MRSLALGAVVAFAVAGSWCASEGDAALGDRIANKVAKDRGLLRMAALTDFQWERLHIFTPYSSWDTIEAELGFAWPEGRRLHLEEREDICLLAFVESSRVVRYVAQHRRRGDFSGLHRKVGYARDDAVFRIDRSQGWPRIVFAGAG